MNVLKHGIGRRSDKTGAHAVAVAAQRDKLNLGIGAALLVKDPTTSVA
jgi:hypothetical protein